MKELKKIKKPSKLNKIDFIIIGILIVVYSLFAFYNLGSFKGPKTYYNFASEGESVDLKLAKPEQNVSKIRYFVGEQAGSYTILASKNGKDFVNVKDFTTTSAFAWEDVELTDKDATFSYISLLSTSPDSYLGEIQLYDQYGEKIELVETSEQSKLLIDEKDTVPVKISYTNSTYFDEIYFATSAYQYAHGHEAMEWVHPPLGKLIMALPIILFGMSTFAFRIMGVIAGILMIPVLYILAKRLFKDTKWAALAGILMTFDNFHFSQTRMGTVDSFLVLFILLSVLFMKDYIDLDKDATFKTKVRKLVLSGLFMGCAITTKWTGLYAALGLAIVFFIHTYKEANSNIKVTLQQKTTRILLTMVFLALIPIGIYYMALFVKPKIATLVTLAYYVLCIISFIVYMIITLLKKDSKLSKIFITCVISFILIPLIIYLISYFCFPNIYNYANNGIKGLLHQTKDMYKYHSELTATHPYQSSWYEWPLMIRPVWLYFSNYGGNIVSTISGIGNPFIWWVGAIASILLLVKTFIKREMDNIFIVVFILCSYIPYIFIGRAMFMYHYFPTLPFVMLAIVSLMKYITEKTKSDMYLKFYIALVIIAFLVFYPISSGMVTSNEYVDSLRWISTWVFR